VRCVHTALLQESDGGKGLSGLDDAAAESAHAELEGKRCGSADRRGL